MSETNIDSSPEFLGNIPPKQSGESVMETRTLIGEHTTLDSNGETVHLKVWNDGFDFNGFASHDLATSREHLICHSILAIIMRNKGTPLLIKDIVTDPGFLPHMRKESSRITALQTTYKHSLKEISAATGLIQTGHAGTRGRAWYGVDVDAQAIEALEQRIANERYGRAVLNEIASGMPLWGGEVPQAPRQVEAVEPHQIDVRQLFLLSKVMPDANEILRYIAQRNASKLSLRDVVQHIGAENLSIRQIAEKIVPGLNAAAESAQLLPRFEIVTEIEDKPPRNRVVYLVVKNTKPKE